jgi:hypothetical protein
MKIREWLASGAVLAFAALPVTASGIHQDGQPGVTVGGSAVRAATNGDVHVGGMAADGGLVANDLGPDNMQAKH